MATVFIPDHMTLSTKLHDVTEMSGISKDVIEKCLECLITSRKCLEYLVMSEKNITSQITLVKILFGATTYLSQTSGNCVNKPIVIYFSFVLLNLQMTKKIDYTLCK